MDWHYVENGQAVGPVTDEQLAQLFATGKINRETLVWRDGLAAWMPYAQARPEAQPVAAAPVAAPVPQAGEVVCAECGKIFPIGETIRHGNAHVCAACKPVFLQKLAEGAPVKTGNLNYARIFTRFAAMLLDGILLGIINAGVTMIIGVGFRQSVAQQTGVAVATMVMFAISMLVPVAYETVMIGAYGATLGKMACGIKVVVGDGGPVGYGRAFGRYFAKMLSGSICLIGYIMALFDDQKRALHDRICNTRVVTK